MALKFRRGSTAQQSGSLAFGEPYVNTTLGTLVIGGASGDIVLSAGGTGSTANFGPISGSGLDITGNANIAGNLTLGGNITIGDAGTDSLVINADLSSSLIPNNDNAFTIGTAALRYSNIYGVNIIGAIQANNGIVSGSSQITYSTISSIPAGIISGAAQVTPLLPTGVVSGSIQVTLGGTSGFSTYNTAVSTITGSLISTASVNTISITNINSVTASALTRLTTLEVETSNLEIFSGSQLGKDATLATYTGSNDTKWSTLGLLSGSFARTNSANVFTGTQTITGSLFISQDLVVAGSSSIQNISSSNLVIGAAFVTLNTNTPSARFAGIYIIDSGSNSGSGSLLYDAVQDEFIQVHKGNGTNVTSSHFVQGPQTYDNLGNELYLTNNRLTKGTGLEHIVDSQISDDGTTVTIPGALTVTGNITGPIRATNGVVSGSSQITYASISSIPAGIVSGAAQVTPLLPTGTISGSSQVVGSAITTNTVTVGTTAIALGGTSTTITGLTSVTSTAFVGALTGNASTATTLATSRAINGVNFDGSAAITVTAAAGTLSGATLASGVTASSLTSVGTLTSLTVSGATATGALTVTGAVTATGDITAFFTSDKRHKNNIQTISNAVLKVKQLNGVTWEWNDDVNEVTKTTPKTGLIAQEVQQVLPQVVIERADGFLALDYSKMVGLLVEAIKEQQIQIDQLKAQIGSK
jgi:hypothetical protein